VLDELPVESAAVRPEKPAIFEVGRPTTYAQLDHAAGALARRLREAGLGPGAVVAIQTPTSTELAVAMLAVWRVGAAALPLDPALGRIEITAYVARSHAAAIIAPGRSLFMPLDDLLSSPPADVPPHTFAPGSPSLMLLSSGTTGLPKFVLRTAAQTRAAAGILGSALPLDKEDRVLSLLPPFHSAGLFNGLLSTLRRGATLVVEEFSPRKIIAAIQSHRVTVMIGMPMGYRFLVETPLSSSPDFASLRLACSGTGPLNRNIVQGFEDRFGLPLTQTYGSTETHVIATTLPGQRVDPPNLVGRAPPPVVVSVRDGDGRPVAEGAEGTLWVRSPGAAGAYFDNPLATAETFRDGWVVTGDLGRFDESGNLLHLGRKRPLVSIAGKKVAPAEIEACLRSHPAVADAAVRLEGEQGGAAFIRVQVVRKGEVTAGELRDFCAARLADFKVPRQIEFVDTLSRGPLGKSV
jgi:long-chain acyl-CoA synthetase